VTELLRGKEPAYGLPLADLFRSIIAGNNTAQQRAQFGDQVTRLARPIILRIIRQYAESSGNHRLLALLDKFQDLPANQPTPRAAPRMPKPRLPAKERDYGSILAVLQRLGRPAGSADLGKYRRRWLEYPPRDPASGYPNRLQEVLAAMTEEGVLTPIRTSKGATLYTLGPNADRYQQAAAG
jgi:hypothetical protein